MDGLTSTFVGHPSVTNRIPDYLKLHVEDENPSPTAKLLPEADRLRALFPAVMGYRLAVDERSTASQLVFPWSDPTVMSYRVSLQPTKKRSPEAGLEATRDMEQALETLLNSLTQTRHELRRREAELATFVPVVSVDDDGEHLADRLNSVLRGCADMLGCFGAGLYLLDESTTVLKLRAHHGLDANAFIRPSRRLENAVADVEALAGHAVVIQDTQKSTHWEVPEPCAAAMCVPISTATSILGTLWLYRELAEDYSPTEQNLAEMMAGRLASDLERAVLTQEVRNHRERPARRQAVVDWSEGRLARFAPVVPGWDIANASTNPKVVGEFCHWHVVADDKLHLGVGASHNATNKTLSAASFQAAHAAHTQHDPKVKDLFTHVNETLWSSSIEGDSCSLFHSTLDPTCGALTYGASGSVFAYLLRPHGWEPLYSTSSLLGSDCDLDIETHRQAIMPGDVLVAFTGESNQTRYEHEYQMNQIAEKLLRNTHLSADELAELATKQLQKQFASKDGSQAVLVAKRAD